MKAFNALEITAKNAKMKTQIAMHSNRVDATGPLPTVGKLFDRLTSNEAYKSSDMACQQGFHQLLTNSPLASGSYQWFSVLRLCYTSTSLVDSRPNLMSMLHFYSAVKQCGLLDITWNDMEYLINYIGPQYLFFGETPKTAEDCLKIYAAMAGFSGKVQEAKIWAFNGAIRVRRSFWEHSFPIARLCSDKLMGSPASEEGSRFNLDDLALVLAELKLQGNKHNIKIDENGKLTNRKELKAFSARSIAPQSPTEFMQSLRTQLEDDVKHMSFDYMTMQRRCDMMFGKIKTEVEATGFIIEPRVSNGVELEREMIGKTLIEYVYMVKMRVDMKRAESKLGVPSSDLEELFEGGKRMTAVVEGMTKCLNMWEKDKVPDLCKDIVAQE